MLDLADARPDSKRDREMRKGMDLKLVRSFCYLLGRVESSLALHYSNTREQLVQLQAQIEADQGRLRGTAYALHAQLVEAMRNGNAERVHNFLLHVATADWLGTVTKVLPLSSPDFPAVESAAFFSTVAADYESTYSRPFDAMPPTESEALSMKSILIATLEKIEEVDPETKREVEALISDFVTIRSNQTNAGTCFNSFGIVYLTVLKEEQEWTTYLESIVHEEAHHHLFALCTIDPLIESDGNMLYRSPIRSEPRPISGVLHAMFVLARTIRCLDIFRSNEKYRRDVNRLPTSYNQANNPAPFEEQFIDAYVTVRDNAKLTRLGQELLESSRVMALGQ